MSAQTFPNLSLAGDSGVMVAFGDSLDMAINNAAHAFDARLRELDWSGVDEIIPAIRGVLVKYDPLHIDTNQLIDKLESLAHSRDWLTAGPNPDRRIWRLPAHYGEESGTDLPAVAKQLGINEQQAIAEHSAAAQRVLMLGFAPGCAYLGSLPPHWDLPRLDYVKTDMPPGSLSVAVRQTVLFATKIPTGWQTIARTPFLSFSRDSAPYFHLAPGDEILFEPIDERTFINLAAEVAAGKSIVQPEAPR